MHDDQGLLSDLEKLWKGLIPSFLILAVSKNPLYLFRPTRNLV